MKNRNLKLTISLAIAAVIGVIALAVGYALSGADIIAWLGSRYAITIYIFVGAYLLVVGFVLLFDRNKRI